MHFKQYISFALFVFIPLLVGGGAAPPMGIQPFLNGVFPTSTPGAVSQWDVETDYDWLQVPSPLRVIEDPSSDNYFLLSKAGQVYAVDFEMESTRLVLDISERTMNLGEGGSVGFAIHPEFGGDDEEKQTVFVFYRNHPGGMEWSDNGYNRLSKFYWNENSDSFDQSSEVVLIQQYDRDVWHNGGGMFFGNDGFLYLSLGDEGREENQAVSTQTLSGGLFSGVLRIDVDNDASRSHPIRRAPIHHAPPPTGWPGTFTQGYMIPNDNPWLDEDGSILEEFFAIGIRSPFSTHYDKETDQIWLADVGSNRREEVSIVTKGSNLQWPYMEGTLTSEVHATPAMPIGEEKTPIFEYDRDVGASIIGAGIYRGDKFPTLNGKYVFADYVFNKLFYLEQDENGTYQSKIMISDIATLDGELPIAPALVGAFILNDGNILLSTLSTEDFSSPGKIAGLKQLTPVEDPMLNLSELGVFVDLETLQPIEGIIPYSVNSPFWSDRAEKKRWVSIPEGRKINFRANEEWTFPIGTVFIKHFELPLSIGENATNKRLETRFFVIGEDEIGYGLTYKWNEAGTEAQLLRIGESEEYEILDELGVPSIQTWDFPSRDQCASCHNSNAQFVLGVKTHQMNKLHDYGNGIVQNQIEHLSELGFLDRENIDTDGLPKAYAIDDADASLDDRVRSYLDSNCAACHRLGGIPDLEMDLRYTLPTNLHNTILKPTKSMSSDPNRNIIEPGDHESSELWIRDNSTDENKMPPIARNVVDEPYVEALAEWIDGLTEEDAIIATDLIFPNPSFGSFAYFFSEEWNDMKSIQVFNSSGQVVFEKSTNELSVLIDLTNANPGVYFIRATSSALEKISKVLIQ